MRVELEFGFLINVLLGKFFMIGLCVLRVSALSERNI